MAPLLGAQRLDSYTVALELTTKITKQFPGGVNYETIIRCALPLTVKRQADACESRYRAMNKLPSPLRSMLPLIPRPDIQVRMVRDITLHSDIEQRPSNRNNASFHERDDPVCTSRSGSPPYRDFGATKVNRRGDLGSDSEAGSPDPTPRAVDVLLSPEKLALQRVFQETPTRRRAGLRGTTSSPEIFSRNPTTRSSTRRRAGLRGTTSSPEISSRNPTTRSSTRSTQKLSRPCLIESSKPGTSKWSVMKEPRDNDEEDLLHPGRPTHPFEGPSQLWGSRSGRPRWNISNESPSKDASRWMKSDEPGPCKWTAMDEHPAKGGQASLCPGSSTDPFDGPRDLFDEILVRETGKSEDGFYDTEAHPHGGRVIDSARTDSARATPELPIEEVKMTPEDVDAWQRQIQRNYQESLSSKEDAELKQAEMWSDDGEDVL